MSANRCVVSFGGGENFWNMTVMMGMQSGECIKTH